MSTPPASHVRRNTNIENNVETTPFAHKYLFKRPVVKEHHVSSYSNSISLQHTRSSHTGFTIPEDEEENEASNGRIDNPMVEKRRFELFIDLIWVGIIGNLVSRPIKMHLLCFSSIGFGGFRAVHKPSRPSTKGIQDPRSGMLTRISQQAEHFSDQAFSSDSTFSIGQAVAEFVILFLIAWR